MFLLLLQIDNAWIEITQKIGFPIAALIAVSYVGAKFLTKVWTYVTKKLDEKDTVINENFQNHKEFRAELLETQKQLVNSQSQIVISQNRITDSMSNICRNNK